MVRATFLKNLAKIGSIQTPVGHRRTNKRATTTFFDPSKTDEVFAFLRPLFENEGPAPLYGEGTVAFQTPGTRTAMFHPRGGGTFVSVSLFRWSE